VGDGGGCEGGCGYEKLCVSLAEQYYLNKFGILIRVRWQYPALILIVKKNSP